MAFNGTMIPGVAPPSGFLFRPAHPASLPFGGFIGVLSGRDSIGPVCASTEAKCAQGDWCCDIGDTCSVLDGAFLCCPPGAAGAGCARVCAAGDFQCGSICCAERQTCGGGDTPSPFCINPTGSSTFPAATTTSTPPATSLATTPTASTTPPILSSTARPTTVSPPKTIPTATPTPTPSRAPSSDTGLPLSAQITMGVLVPFLVILLVIGLWFCLFRRPARRRREIDERDLDLDGVGGGRGAPSDRRRPSTPPPAYTKNEIVVATTSQGYTFSRARSPGQGHELETLRRPGTAGRGGRSERSLSPTETYREGVSRLDV
ncbi:hypothetical protein QBC39DRAFT_385397 [Podospora conica]|nr:hypothetical protein QBC39DRAFT_385397 [Schizothecium conicum]